MKSTQTLTLHRDIRNWVADRKGMPALRRIPNRAGEIRARLALNFPRPQPAPRTMPSQDDGITPCSWSAWLAELDRQNLALKVTNHGQPAFEFIERKDYN